MRYLSQLRARNKWNAKHKDKMRHAHWKSSCKHFIKYNASPTELKLVEKWIAEKRSTLQK